MGGKGRAEEYILSEAQLQKLWNQCHDAEDKVLIGLLAFHGMRVGEACHLRLDWIREEEIHIPSSQPCHCLDCYERGYWKPKSQAGVRAIPIPGFLKPILLDYLRKNPEGLKMNRQAAWYRIQRLVEKAKLPHTFCHSLRATYATTLASKGLTAVEICSVLGWARFSMGEHYIRMAEGRAGAREKIKKIWG